MAYLHDILLIVLGMLLAGLRVNVRLKHHAEVAFGGFCILMILLVVRFV